MSSSISFCSTASIIIAILLKHRLHKTSPQHPYDFVAIQHPGTYGKLYNFGRSPIPRLQL